MSFVLFKLHRSAIPGCCSDLLRQPGRCSPTWCLSILPSAAAKLLGNGKWRCHSWNPLGLPHTKQTCWPTTRSLVPQAKASNGRWLSFCSTNCLAKVWHLMLSHSVQLLAQWKKLPMDNTPWLCWHVPNRCWQLLGHLGRVPTWFCTVLQSVPVKRATFGKKLCLYYQKPKTNLWLVWWHTTQP